MRTRFRLAPLAVAVAIAASSCIVMVSFDDYELAPKDASVGGGTSGMAGQGGLAGAASGGVAGAPECADASEIDGASCTEPCGSSKWIFNWTLHADASSRAMTVTDEGDLLVAARFQDTFDLDGTGGADALTATGAFDAFVVAIDPYGTVKAAGTFGSEGSFAFSEMDVAEGAAFLSGWCTGEITYHSGTTNSTLPFGALQQAIVLTLPKNLSQAGVAASYWSDPGSARVDSVAAVGSSGVLVAGRYAGTVTGDLDVLQMGALSNFLFARVEPSHIPQWQFGYGDDAENSQGVRTATFGEYAFLTGRFSGAVAFGALPKITGTDSLFLAVYAVADGEALFANTWGGENGAEAVDADAFGVTVAGFIKETADFGGGLERQSV